MLKLTLSLLLLSTNIMFGQLNRTLVVDELKRDDGSIYAWIYFNDKPELDNKVKISKRAIARRNRNLTDKDLSWYDVSPSDKYISQIIDTGAKLRSKSRWFNSISIKCTEEQMSQILLLPFVKDVQPLKQSRKPISTYNDNGKNLNRLGSINSFDYGGSKEQLEQINVPKAHEAGYSGEGITILVLDTGFNLDHPVFNSINVVAEWDVINDDSTTANEDGQDSATQQNHGTSVLSIAGGYTPGTLIGPAYNANYILAKTERIAEEVIAEEEDFIKALEWGEAQGVDIITTSVGYIDWYTPNDMDGNTALMTKAYDIAASQGVLCIASAGNENGNYWDAVTPPADADSVIAVGAVKSDGLIATFSSRGPTVDGRIKPEVCAWGDNTYMARGTISYGTGDGTSYAAPLVAGAAALVMEAHPDWPAMAIREAILNTASQSNNENNTYGWGIMDTWAAIKTDGGNALKPELEQNYPNPVSDYTTIEYLLKQSASVELTIYNILGNHVITLVDKFEASGDKSISWNGKDSNGKRVSNGVYFYSLKIGDTQVTNKLVVIN